MTLPLTDTHLDAIRARDRIDLQPAGYQPSQDRRALLGHIDYLLARLRRAEAVLDEASILASELRRTGSFIRQWARPPCPEQNCRNFDAAAVAWWAFIERLDAQEATDDR